MTPARGMSDSDQRDYERRSVTALLYFSVFLLTVPAYAQTTYNTGGAGSWENAANWSNGVPGPASTVFVDGAQGTPATAILNQSEAISSLTIHANTGGQNMVDIGGNTLTLGSNSQNNIYGSGVIMMEGGTLTSNGIATLNNDPTAGGYIIGAGNISHLNIGPTSNFLQIHASGGLLTLDTSTGSYTNYSNAIVGFGSTMTITGSNFTNFQGGSLNGGLYQLNGGLQFTGANALTNIGDSNSTQLLIGSGGQVLDQNNNTVLGNFSIPNNLTIGTNGRLQLGDGLQYGNAITGFPTIENDAVSGTFDQTTNPAGLEVFNGTTLNLANLTGTGNLNIDGNSTVSVIGNLGIVNSGNLVGNLRISDLTPFTFAQLNFAGTIQTNSANLVLEGNFQVVTTNSTDALTNLGINNGTLTLNNANYTFNTGLLTNNGSINISSPACLASCSITLANQFDNEGGVFLSNKAALNVGAANGFLNVDSSGNFNSNPSNPNPSTPVFNLSGGSTLTYFGNDIKANYTTLTLSDTSQIVNTAGGAHDALASTLTYNGGTLNLVNGANETLTGGDFTNAGTVSIDPTSTLKVASGSYIETGTTDVSGSLLADTIQINGGQIFGSGSIMGASHSAAQVLINNGGTLGDATGGDPNLSTDNVVVNAGGTWNLGDPGPSDVISADLMANSITMLYLAGPGNFDSIDAADGITLGGTLELIFENGFLPGSNETFDLFVSALGAGAINGSFSQIELFTLSGGTLTPFAGTVTPGSTLGDFVVSPAASVPEPGSYGLLIAGLGAGMIYLRRRKNCR